MHEDPRNSRRRGDPRIGTAIERALAGCKTILNVGAGTGSYEPQSRMVIAVEPSRTMIAQRPVGAAPVVQAFAEALPFQNDSFDAVLATLTVHHWKDQAKGFAECGRVARSRIVFLTRLPSPYLRIVSTDFSAPTGNDRVPIWTRSFEAASQPFPKLVISTRSSRICSEISTPGRGQNGTPTCRISLNSTLVTVW